MGRAPTGVPDVLARTRHHPGVTHRASSSTQSTVRTPGVCSGEFVNRWTTGGFRSYIGDLQNSVDRQLEASVGEQAREAEDAFFWVTHYERGFWDMAMSG